MKISELSVKHPQLTLIVFSMLALIGFSSFRSIPRSEDPQIPFPAFLIVAIQPGGTPHDLEEAVANPIEEKLGELEDIMTLDSRISDGLSVTYLEFESHVDATAKENDVRRQVESARASLPSDLYRLDVKRISTTDVSLVQVAITSDTASWQAMREVAEELEKKLEAVPGIRQAKVWAAPEKEARVSVDVGKLAELGIPFDQLMSAIGSDNLSLPSGKADLGTRSLLVKPSGPLRNVEDLKKVVVAGNGSAIVTLDQVAGVGFRDEEQHHIARYNGKRAVFVTANQKPGQNVFAVQKAVAAVLAESAAALPASMKFERGFDQAANVDRRLGRLYTDFAIAILLVLITLLPLGLRASLLVMLSIPLSLAIGIALLHAAGQSLNQLSIVGFVIALGLLVDDSIVVVENITRFLRDGHSRTEAAILATRQISVAVMGCTATLLFAFVPLLFLPGSAGDFIRSMPLAVVFTILASLLVSLTIVPFLASQILPRGHEHHKNRALTWLTHVIEATYRPVLARVMKHPRMTLLAAAGLFAGSLLLIPSVGFSLFPKADSKQFLVTIEAPEGTRLDRTNQEVRFVEEVLAKKKEVLWTMSNVGRGNPLMYYNIVERHEAEHYAEVFVELVKYDPKTTPAFYEELRREFRDRPGARIYVKEFENGPPVDAPVAMRLLGDDLETLSQAAAQVEDVLRNTPGTMYIENPAKHRRTDLVANIDTEAAGMLGVPRGRIAQMLRLGLSGLPAGTLRDEEGDDSTIAVTLDGMPRNRLQALPELRVQNVLGATLPLGDMVHLELANSPTLIQHWGAKQRAVTVKAFVQSGFNTDRVTKQVLASLAEKPLPGGVRLIPAGEIESRQKSFGGLGTAILVAVFMILAILVLEFKTFRSTLVVASVIPLGILGGLVGLWLTGYTLSFTAVVGFIALIGIEIKNSILLVDFTNQLRREGLDLNSAIQKAGEIRFLPIVLTTATAIGGLLPLAIQGSALYSPLAIVIVGGLLSSTLLSRLVTPVAYQLLAPSLADEPVRAVQVSHLSVEKHL